MTLDYRNGRWTSASAGISRAHQRAAIPDWAHARPLVERAGHDRETAMRTIFGGGRPGRQGAVAVVEELAVFLGSAVANIVAVPRSVARGVRRRPEIHGGKCCWIRCGAWCRIVPNVPMLATSALGDDAPLLGSVISAMEVAEPRLAAIACSARRQ
jgi:hypothetical protein